MSQFKSDFAKLSPEQRREIIRQANEVESQLSGTSDFDKCTNVFEMPPAQFNAFAEKACAEGDAQKRKDEAAKAAAEAARYAARRAGLPETMKSDSDDAA